MVDIDFSRENIAFLIHVLSSKVIVKYERNFTLSFMLVNDIVKAHNSLLLPYQPKRIPFCISYTKRR
jgi:hypothetical protein